MDIGDDFGALVGFEDVSRRLLRGIASGRAAHAQIFLGDEGSGKKSLAKAYARALLCEDEGRRPCGTCTACRQVAHGNHPDLHWYRRQGAAHKVEMVKRLQEDLNRRAYADGFKVLVVEDAHTMNPPAQNKLLKSLEEPPARSVLLLLCESTTPLLPTVLSRCQVVRMPRVPRDVIAALLAERGVPAGQAPVLAALADGRVGRALALAASPEALALRDEALALLIAAMEPGGAIRALEGLQARRAMIGPLLTLWQTLLRDALARALAAVEPIHSDRPEGLARLAAYPPERIEAALEAVAEAQRRLQGNGMFLPVCHWLLLAMEGFKDAC